MNILVTGGAGFIGSHVADRFVEEGHNVIILDNLSSGKEDNVNKKAKFYKIDIRDKEIEDIIFKRENIDCINHHAAQISVRNSVDDPIYDGEINILGSLNLLQNAVKYGIKRVIFASTGGAIYGEQDYFPADERHPLRPVSPYGVAKLSVEGYLYFYHTAYNLDYTVLRYANIYGPRQDPHGEAGVVAIFTQKLLNNEQPVINGDGEQTRDYTFVGDIVEANSLAFAKSFSGIFNIGTGVECSVNELCNRLTKLINSGIVPLYGQPKLGEQRRSVLDWNKIKGVSGWSPRSSLDKGLKETIDYFRRL
ncbi:MAG: NAD-dependent epimerase/dehydratase family protein [Nitrospinota bacterium]